MLSFVERLGPAIEAALDDRARYPAECPRRLEAAIRHSLLAPGKRLRPLLVLLAAEACGATAERAMPAACALEMVHTYSLIHDDLPAMDDDDLRRGRPTCHKAFDEATAILAGDALLTQAFEVLASEIEPAAAAAECCRILAQAAGACGMVAGQVDDLAAETAAWGLDELESIHERKTGALLRAALALGGCVAGASDEIRDGLEGYGAKLGLAFQIVDDLLDARGDAAAMGKSAGKDVVRGKLTFPSLLGVEASRGRAEQLVAEAIAALRPLGESSASLTELARYVLTRNR